MNNFSTKVPFNGAVTGIATFAKSELCLDIRHCQADIAVIGAPFDIAIWPPDWWLICLAL